MPDIDQCYVGDDVCIEEANMQYLRDMQVDTAIKDLLRKRFDDCLLYEYPNHDHINDKDSPCYEIRVSTKATFKVNCLMGKEGIALRTLEQSFKLLATSNYV